MSFFSYSAGSTVIARTDDAFISDVLGGLSSTPKTLPCKYFYDERGSKLFDLICELDEYYPTRTETAILCQNIDEIASLFEPDTLVVEYGSGSSKKTRILLDRLPAISGYVPVDISREHLAATAEGLRSRYPHLTILPVCADYTDVFELPEPSREPSRVVAFFPGSTIGNFHPDEAVSFLSRIATACGPGGGLLIGVDLQKDLATVELAYNDRQGVTAAFNLNLLHRINHEAGGDFALDQFLHHAFYNARLGRIEMHLVSRRDQRVQIGGQSIGFSEGETILTECSYKYTLAGFAALARDAGFQIKQVWTDPKAYFSVQYLTVA